MSYNLIFDKKNIFLLYYKNLQIVKNSKKF